MVRQVRTCLMVGALTLAALGTASAQIVLPPTGAVAAYSGAVTPFGYQPGVIPRSWYLPQVSLQYDMPPQVVYVPVAVAAPRPPVELIQTMTVTLRSGAPPVDVRVKPGTVVTWTNGDGRSRTLILGPAEGSGSSAQAGSESGVAPAHSSVSLAFNQPGIYRYYLQDRPDQWARILVEQ